MGAILAAMVLLSGCGGGGATVGSVTPLPTKQVLIINGLGKTLSVIDPTTNTIQNNVVPLGEAPNQLQTRGVYAYVVNSVSNNVQIIDMTASPAPQTVGTIDLGAGSNPWAIQFVSDPKAYVSDMLTNKVSVLQVNGGSGSVVKAIDVGIAPEGMATANGKVYVCCTAFDSVTFGYGQGTVRVIDVASDTVTKVINVGTNPQAAAVGADGNVHVLCTGNYFDEFGAVYRIDPTPNTVTGAPIALGGSPGSLVVAPNGKAYAADWTLGVLSYNSATGAVLHAAASPLKLGKGVNGGIADSTGKLYVGNFDDDTVSILDTADDQVVTALGAGDGPQGGGSRSRVPR